MDINKLKKELKEKKVIFGYKNTLKYLKSAKIEKIVLSEKFPEIMRETLIGLAKENKVEVEIANKSPEEIAEIAKKPFAINVICFPLSEPEKIKPEKKEKIKRKKKVKVKDKLKGKIKSKEKSGSGLKKEKKKKKKEKEKIKKSKRKGKKKRKK